MAVVLPDGTEISDEEYAAMVAQASGTGIPTSGTVLGTNYNFVPSTSGLGGGLNLGWDQTPGFGAAINFDPTAGWENAFIGNYDVSGQGQAIIGDASSPDAVLGLTAGLEGTGLNTPNPYIKAAVTDVVPGFNAYTGTNVPTQATFSAGNIGDQGYNLNLQQTSGDDPQARLRAKLMGFPSAAFQPDEVQDATGLFLNLSTDPSKTNPSGFEFKGTLDDLGTLGRRVGGWAKDVFGNIISDAGATTEDTSPGFMGPGGLLFPSLEAASQAGAVQSKYGAGGYSGKIGPGDTYPLLMPGEEIITPTTAGTAEVYNPGMTYSTLDSPFDFAPENLSGGISRVPEDSMATEEFDSDEEVLTPSGWMDLNVDVNDPTYDPIQHLDTIYGSITQPSVHPVTGEYLLHRDLTKIAPQVIRDIALNIKDTAKKADEQASGKSIAKVQQDIQDVVNNMIGWDARKAGIDIRDTVKTGAHPTIVTNPKQLQAMAKLMQSGDASLEDSAMKMATQVDTFALPDFTAADQAVDARTKAMIDQDMAIAMDNLMESPPEYIDPSFTASIQETVPLPPAAPAVPYMDQILGEGLTRRQVMAEKAASASARQVQAAAEQAAEAAEVQASIDRAIQRASMGQIDLTTREHPGIGGDVRQVSGVSPSMGADYSAGLDLEAVRRAQAASALAQMQASMGVDPADVAAERAIGAAGMGGQVAGFHPGWG